MRVINTQSWAGENFSYVPGDVVDLPSEVAEARIAAGLAEQPVEEQGELPLGDSGAAGKRRRTVKG